MHHGANFKYGCFQLFCEQRDFAAVFWLIFLVVKAKLDQSSCWFPFNFLHVNDVLANFMRRLERSGKWRQTHAVMLKMPFLNRLEILCPISSLKISEMSKNAFLAKNSGSHKVKLHLQSK